MQLAKDVQDIETEFKEVYKAEFLDKKLPPQAKDKNRHAHNIKELYGNMSNEEIQNYLKGEHKRLKEDLEDYKDKLKEAIAKKYLKSDINLDNTNKRDRSPTEDLITDKKRIKQDSTDVVNDGSEPTSLYDLDGGE